MSGIGQEDGVGAVAGGQPGGNCKVDEGGIRVTCVLCKYGEPEPEAEEFLDWDEEAPGTKVQGTVCKGQLRGRGMVGW